MRNTLAFILLVISLPVSAQRSVRDSVNYYNRQLSRIYSNTWDSLRNDDSVKYYNQRIKHASAASKSYTALVIFGEATSADFGAFNLAIARDGFGPLSNNPMPRIGVGVSHKGYSGVMVDFNFFVAGFNRTVKNGDAKITASCSDIFQLQVGYAVVNYSRFNVYPYGGLALRGTMLEYTKPAVLNVPYNSLASLIQNDQTASGKATHLSYQAGLGIEWAISHDAQHHGGIMLFGKFGTDGIFGSEDYKIHDVDYGSGIRYGVWAAELGLKIF
jgi:hypothetical protein